MRDGSGVWAVALLSCIICTLVLVQGAGGKAKEYTVVGGGGTALRDFVSDAVGNATQDANYKGFYLPFYTVGTGAGQQYFLNNTFTYTVGDFPLSKKGFESAARPILQIPLSFGPVAVYANLSEAFHAAGYTLQLSAEVAAGIFQGAITTWDDKAILALNPNLTKLSPPIAPNTKISVVIRNDSSAAANSFSQWLAAAGNHSWTGGVNQTLPGFLGATLVSGGTAVTNFIGSKPYSIGFSDAYAGKKAKLADAAVRNSAGKFIRYSKADWTFTSLDIPIPPVDGDWSRFNLTDLEGEKTYPIVTTTIIATDSDLTGREGRGAAQKAVFGYMLGPAVQTAARSYEQFALNPRILNASVTAVNAIRVIDSRDFFQADLLPPGIKQTDSSQQTPWFLKSH